MLSLVFGGTAVAFADAATTFYGSTAGQPTFNRPASLDALSGVSARYTVQPFRTNADSDCTIEGIQEGSFDGMLFLYQGSFDSANPLAHLIAYNDDSTNGSGSSRLAPLSLDFSADYFLVTAGYQANASGTFSNLINCDAPATRVLAGYGTFGDDDPSDYDGRSAQLLGGRFEVSVVGNNFALDPFVGRTVPLASNDSALFWFFQPANFELLVKIVDGCSLNNRFWVFYAATTNVEFTLTVVDTFADPGANTRTYHNPLGTNEATAITDNEAFNTCN